MSCGEGVGRVDDGDALEIDVRLGKLRTDIVYVVGHAAQHGLDHRFMRLAARALVAMKLLNPLEIDRWNDADEQIRVARNVHFLRLHRAMEAFVEQNVGAGGKQGPPTA